MSDQPDDQQSVYVLLQRNPRVSSTQFRHVLQDCAVEYSVLLITALNQLKNC